jgi:negative regulator of flagellin synthesis FlgM
MNRIDGLNPLGTSRTMQGQGAGAPGDSSTAGRAGEIEAGGRQDEVTLSNRGRGVAEAMRTVVASPDVRSGRVAALKAAIADGSYSSNAGEIARRLLANGSFGE